MAHLTIPAGEPWVSYTPASATTGPFVVPFPIFSTDDLNVAVDGALLSASDWTFTPTDTRDGGYQAGGVSLNVATALTVVIYRDVVRARTSDYASGPLDINSLNSDLDRTVARDQDARLAANRSLRAPLYDAAFDELPNAETRANCYLAFDASGAPVMVAAGVSSVPVSSFMATILDDTAAPAAQQTLGMIGLMHAAYGGI